MLRASELHRGCMPVLDAVEAMFERYFGIIVINSLPTKYIPDITFNTIVV